MATFPTTTSALGALQQLFSVRDAAAYLGVSPASVRRRIAAGTVRAHRWGRAWTLWRDDLDWSLYCTWLASAEGAMPGAALADEAEATGIEGAEPLSGHRGEPDVA